MRILRTTSEVREALGHAGGRVGLVPTMGAFHGGHLALMQAAREACDIVVVSLFVNPSQFNAAEDLEHYPRDEAADARAAADTGVDLLFAPSVEEFYPSGFDTWVVPGEPAATLEGASRPDHFKAVATVCTKLFSIVQPNLAFFGRKDAQQVAVVKRLVADLNLPLEIVAVPIVRDADGLALSSRNVFLSTGERTTALALPRALDAGLAAHRSGGNAVQAARSALDEERGLAVEYVAVADLDGPTLCAAVRVGATRLIDNVHLGHVDNADR
ncbi:MAG: pantoate--beta-alanine ligase [Chloroflexota bacterium]|nr:pantoate--beta-alanine ligase [Chloroflexota bacterium]